MVINGRTVQSNTQRAEANVDNEVSRSSKDLLVLVVPPSVGEFCMSDANVVGGGPYRMPDVVVVRLLLLLILSDGGVSPNENDSPSIIVLGRNSSSEKFRSSASLRLLSRVLVRNDVDVVLRRYAL